MENTTIENTEDVIEDITEETLLSLDENLELDQEVAEISEAKYKKEEEDEEESYDSEDEEEEEEEDEDEDEEEDEDDMMEAANANSTLDDFASGAEIISVLNKISGVKAHLKKIKASIYFDDSDFVIGDKTAARDVLFSPKVKLSDLVRLILQAKGVAKEPKEQRADRVIVSAKSEAEAKKIIALVKANNAKAASKEKKAKAQMFGRKDGFKVYITGNSVAAIAPYKKMAEATETYDEVDMFIFENILIEAEVNSDQEFMEYAKKVLKSAHGENYDEKKAMETIEGILKKADGDYGAAIGMLTSGLGEEDINEEKTTDTTIYSSDIKRLVETEEGLTEGFKAKAALIFEAEVRTKVEEAKTLLESEYEVKLAEEVERVTESLTNQVDEYLTYAVEQWIEENKVAVEGSLRASIAENFMSSLKALFVENYIEVPESKVDLFDKLEEETAQLKEDLAKAERIAESLAERVDALSREKVLAEATKDLAQTQSAKLLKLVEGIEFDENFAKKVETLKEFYFTGETETLTESSEEAEETVETIVEGAEEVVEAPTTSKQMQAYLQTLSRIQKSAT